MTDEELIRARKVLTTEEEWQSWDHFYPLACLIEGNVSERKACLFESACLRRLWHWSGLKKDRWTVDVLERHADELATAEEVQQARLALRQVRQFATCVMGGMWNRSFEELENHELEAWPTAQLTAEAMAIAAGRLARAAAGLEDDRPDKEQQKPEVVAQCNLLRCIFGNPFRSVPVDPAWQTPDVTALAQAIYDERRFEHLPILADALEEAGCTSDDILGHCRDDGEHARGCWPVDLLLGKK